MVDFTKRADFRPTTEEVFPGDLLTPQQVAFLDKKVLEMSQYKVIPWHRGVETPLVEYHGIPVPAIYLVLSVSRHRYNFADPAERREERNCGSTK